MHLFVHFNFTPIVFRNSRFVDEIHWLAIDYRLYIKLSKNICIVIENAFENIYCTLWAGEATLKKSYALS
jgi:hypothetical protein